MINFVDGHCDTIVKIAETGETLLHNTNHIDLERLKKLGNPLQFFAIWLEPKYYPVSLRQTLKYIDFYYRELHKNEEFIQPVFCFDDIIKNEKQDKMSALLSIEGGEALEGDISVLRILYRLGVRAMTLTWNYRNAIADGVLEREAGGGLTKFGREVVKEMNRLGMIVDVSHLSEAGFWDVESCCNSTFIASHSNAKGVCPVPRNLSNAQIKAIAQCGGVIGLNLYSPFLSDNGESCLKDILKHIDYVIELVGDDFIGFGCDFDGIDQTPSEIHNILDMELLLETVERRYGKETREKIAEKNFLRVLKNILK